MKTVGNAEAWAYFDGESKIRKASNSTVRGAPGHPVSSYLELAKKVAELQFRNPEHVLLFRGQAHDYKNQKKNTTLKPSLFRHRKQDDFHPPSRDILAARFARLRAAEEGLTTLFTEKSLEGKGRLQKHRILRWAIAQHYELCATPLLDVTQSIRVAASFASDRAQGEVFFYVLAAPNISGAVTASAEAELQIVRLAGICPPMAVRPHIQEGYLLGEYPDLPDVDQKQLYSSYEIDFGRRMIAKFRLDVEAFWRDQNFHQIPHKALYPNEHDELFQLIKTLKESYPQESA